MSDKQGGRYGALIKQAKQAQPESQEAIQPDSQMPGKPEEKKASQSTIEPDNQIPRKPDSQIPSPPVPDEKQVNLCVKVPESLRRHWAIQAKIQGITMTAVMVEALTQKFGLPDDQMTR